MILVLSVYPVYQLSVPSSITMPDSQTIHLEFDKPVLIDFIDVNLPPPAIGTYDLRAQRLQLDHDRDLKPIKEVRLTPRPDGIRFVLTETALIQKARLTLSDIGDISVAHPLYAIAGKVNMGFSWPWEAEPELPAFPPKTLVAHTITNMYKPEAIAYRGYGWSGVEDWGTWMDGPYAELKFTMEASAAKEARIVLEGQPFLDRQQPKVLVDVVINGIRAGTMSMKELGLHRFEFSLPQSKTESMPIQVVLNAHSTMSPQEAGLNIDQRQLSFGLVRFWIE
jgi:hypothetical protein